MDKTLWLNRCHFGDVRAVLRRMVRDGVKVDCIVTSPPYWGLRDYGADGQIGLEPSFKQWLSEMRKVFKLLHLVLADHGTAWVNMGDSYSTRSNGPVAANATALHGDHAHKYKGMHGLRSRGVPDGFKNKDMIGQPWRLAFALQDAGWYLRQDIIWAKPNPMPESIKDRCTKSHEYIFLLAKSERYHFDFEAFQEPVSGGAHARSKDVGGWASGEVPHCAISHNTPKARGVGFGHGVDKELRGRGRVKNNASMDAALIEMRATRNRRSVWTIPTQGFDGAHFATFPTALIEPCVLAGCPPGGVVLDPFFGTGTTGEVAQKLGFNWIGIEINRGNEPFQRKRLAQLGLVL